LDIPLIVGASIIGAFVLLVIVGYIIWRIRRSREMRNPNNFIYD
jgi:uncharacterized protein (DUF2062 family)